MKIILTIIATTAINAGIAFVAVGMLRGDISSASASIDRAVKEEAENIYEEYSKNSTYLFGMTIEGVDVRLKAQRLRQSEELQSIERKIDSLKTDIQALNIYSISRQLDEIEKQTKYITSSPSSFAAPSAGQSLDEKMDYIQTRVDSIERRLVR